MVDQLIETMGKEYAQSSSGKLYHAYRSIMEDTSVGKIKSLGAKINGLYPSEMRNLIGYEITSVNGMHCARWAKEEPWNDCPDFPRATLMEVSTFIMFVAPRSCKSLLKLWQENPKRVAWETVNAFMLLSSIDGLGHGWG